MSGAVLDRAREMIAESLSAFSGTWAVDGELVKGPGTTGVVVAELHAPAPRHLDVGFMLNRDRPDVPVIWDCAVGIGATDEETLRRAVDTWTTCTASVMLELLTHKGQFADHYRGNDAEGFAGWHAIHGPWQGWGIGSGPEELQRWALAHPVLPQLREAVEPELGDGLLHGMKIFFGSSRDGDTAEVRIDGEAKRRPSEALLALSWPRVTGTAYVRAFVLLVHPDPGAGVRQPPAASTPTTRQSPES